MPWLQTHRVVTQWRGVVAAAFHGVPAPAVTNRRGIVERLIVLNTLRHHWSKLRCGIFVRVTGGRVAAFFAFANPDFCNDGWADPSVAALMLPGGGGVAASLEEYCEAKRRALRSNPEAARRYQPLRDTARWWRNAGGVVCNILSPHVWGTSFLPELLEMVQAGVAAVRHSGSGCFMMNKRDAAQRPRIIHTPIPLLACLGFYGGISFEDICVPVARDWASPDAWPRPEPESWARRAPTAVFRGSSTGTGITPRWNQRLLLARKVRDEGLAADVGLTSTNRRDRVLPRCLCPGSAPSRRIAFDAVERPLAAFLDMSGQRRHRAALYVCGHSAADRLCSLLRSGFVVLRVRAQRRCLACRRSNREACIPPVAERLWADAWLQGGTVAHHPPGTTHLMVAADLSDLPETLAWVRDNPEASLAVAQAGFDAVAAHGTRGEMARFVGQRIHRVLVMGWRGLALD